jgi:opacity protein-like surface antigen
MKYRLVVMALALAAASIAAAQAANPAEKQAEQSATQWLALIDNGNYGKSWDDAATSFKGHVTKPSWEQAVKAVREPLGALTSRHLKSATYSTQLPGAPDGKYVVIKFDTKFKNKADAVETITPMLDHGVWKVSGYYIR